MTEPDTTPAAEKPKKKRRTIDEQIAELESKRAHETARLLAREKAHLGVKAINKHDFATAILDFEGAIKGLRELSAPTQVEVDVEVSEDEKPF